MQGKKTSSFEEKGEPPIKSAIGSLLKRLPAVSRVPISTGLESGQSIVLLALMFVILLLFVALAVDVGFAFVRSSQFSAAVDSAALAGVVDLDPSTNDTAAADIRAEQFLAANGWSVDTLVGDEQ